MQPLQRGNIRLAATVMLVRDSNEGLQVYMIKRPGRGDFPDLHVFPGGKLEENDWNPDLCKGLSDEDASGFMGIESGGLRYWFCVARECFEECGVLLATTADGQFLTSDKRLELASKGRQELLAGALDWAVFLESNDLVIMTDRLVYFSHWITPEAAPRRFDTRFFLAAMPEAQKALADTSETADDGQWIKPQSALNLYKEKEWLMIDPTLRSLEALVAFDNVEKAISGVRAAEHVIPWTEDLGRQGMQPRSS